MKKVAMEGVDKERKQVAMKVANTNSPIAQMADIGFKVVLLERLNQKWKQKHF